MARSRKRSRGRVLITATFLVTALGIAVAAIGTGPRFISVTGEASIIIPGASLKPGDVRFYSYRDDAGRKIRFILGRDETGQVRAAFDACQQCAQYGKGYTSSHGYLVCRYCGNRYKLSGIGSGTSCAPIKLQVRENAGAVVVDTSQLEEHKKLF